MKKILATLLVVALVASVCGMMFVSADAANLAAGKEVANATVNVANANYCANLTDGVIADAISTENGVWFGYLYNKDKPENANTAENGIAIPTIDLGAVTELSSARIHIVDQADWGICAPDSIVAQVSNDGENFTDVATVTEFQSGVAWVEFDLSGQSAQYVRLAIDLSTTWFFLDEIEIYGAASEGGEDTPDEPAAEEHVITISHVNCYTWGVYNEMIITGEGQNAPSKLGYDCTWWIALKVDKVDGVLTVTQIEGNGEAKEMTASADGFIVYCYSNDAASFAAAQAIEVGDVLLSSTADWSADAASETAIGTLTFGPAVENDKPVAPVVKETIKIDGKLNDDGYDKAVWNSNGLWQKSTESDFIIEDIEASYTVRTDDENVYIAIKVNQGADLKTPLDIASYNQDGATNFRIWVMGDGMDARTFYDLLWDGEAFALYKEKVASEELTYVANVSDDGITLEVAVAKETLKITDSFKLMVTYSTPYCGGEEGAYNAFHLTPCESLEGISWWGANVTDTYAEFNCADIALGTKAPATGDEGILVFALLGLVAIAGAAVTIKSKI